MLYFLQGLPLPLDSGYLQSSTVLYLVLKSTVYIMPFSCCFALLALWLKLKPQTLMRACPLLQRESDLCHLLLGCVRLAVGAAHDGALVHNRVDK